MLATSSVIHRWLTLLEFHVSMIVDYVHFASSLFAQLVPWPFAQFLGSLLWPFLEQVILLFLLILIPFLLPLSWTSPASWPQPFTQLSIPIPAPSSLSFAASSTLPSAWPSLGPRPPRVQQLCIAPPNSWALHFLLPLIRRWSELLVIYSVGPYLLSWPLVPSDAPSRAPWTWPSPLPAA